MSPSAPAAAPVRRTGADGTAPLLWAAAAALFVFWVFSPSLGNGFVSWDDPQNFLDNPHYRGLGPERLKWMWTTFHMGHYIPLTWMTLGLDYTLGGMDPFVYHLTNVALHSLGAALFFLVARRLLDAADVPARDAAAFAAALLYAVHPLRVESVAWVTERRDVLSGVFAFLSAWLYLRHARGEGGRFYWGALASFAAAALSKENVAALAAGWLVVDVYPLRRLGGAAGWTGPSARAVLKEKVPFFVVAALAALALVRATAELGALKGASPVEARLGAAQAVAGLGAQTLKTFVPSGFSPVYESTESFGLSTPAVRRGAATVLAVSAAAFLLRRRRPGLAAAWAFQIVMLSPTLGVTDSVNYTNDRYGYLALLGWPLLAAGWVFSGGAARRMAGAAALAAAIAFLAAGSRAQARVWKDSETLWRHAVDVDPGSSVSNHRLGAALRAQGRAAEALPYMEAAVRLVPRPEHYNGLGNALLDLGRPREALESFERALAAAPRDPLVLFNAANAAYEASDPRAEELYRRSIAADPDFAPARINFGDMLARRHRWTEAADQFREAVRLAPDSPEARNNLGFVLERLGLREEAAGRYREALRLRPGYEDALRNLRRLEG